MLIADKRKIAKAGWYGLIAGIILSIVFKLIEQITQVKVYTLLLNVDYIPIINRYYFPEIIEVSFHLVVSILLSMVLLAVLQHERVTTGGHILAWCTAICTLIGLLLFPTTALSDRTPAVTSIPALSYWLAGHALYGLVLGFLFKRDRQL
ncbi:hypothetical protein ACP2W0_02330 [Pseudobacillus badius]|uniref:hypothetical protein n=1 Tax=Bacillus badius TaxID=1455 RepID=UPI0007B041BF|nr:hypothetical protein [Bacillus badius]KZO00034.1 hypothetical protein A4244_03805 [Bacillus badius]OCS86196.1 hypothetical protein A6M11_03800 [Bacillus badius]OVE52342.1 hypothetical protein B1A98_08085 [Bacillus badius]TDW04070.1 hypothetical protein B0G66_103369 [Bacillus badius]